MRNKRLISDDLVAREGVAPRRQPFQGCSRPGLSVDSARHSSEKQPDFILFIGAKMQPSCTNLSLPRLASIRHGFMPENPLGSKGIVRRRFLSIRVTAVKGR